MARVYLYWKIIRCLSEIQGSLGVDVFLGCIWQPTGYTPLWSTARFSSDWLMPKVHQVLLHIMSGTPENNIDNQIILLFALLFCSWMFRKDNHQLKRNQVSGHPCGPSTIQSCKGWSPWRHQQTNDLFYNAGTLAQQKLVKSSPS